MDEMYLSIASLQHERKDPEAVKTTFQEMIQLEWKRTPRKDWNLVTICQRQARIGLINEAKNTAALIVDPDARRQAESYITKGPSRPQ